MAKLKQKNHFIALNEFDNERYEEILKQNDLYRIYSFFLKI